VGKNCINCRHFIEEKHIRRPEIKVSPEEYSRFLEELDYFEDWLQDLPPDLIDIQSKIKWIKPHLEQKRYKDNQILSLKGFILGFREMFIGMDLFRDSCYATINTDMQNKWRFKYEDEITGRAKVAFEEGFLHFTGLREIEIIKRGENSHMLTSSDAQVIRQIGKIHEHQSEKCTYCPAGNLIFVRDYRRKKILTYRRNLCAEGIEHPSLCPKSIETLKDKMNPILYIKECPDLETALEKDIH